MSRYPSPLRYPGGKRQLTNFIKALVVANGLRDGHYVEPYAGGASIALRLLFDEYVRRIHINDLNYPVYAFWWSVLFETDGLCSLIEAATVSMDEWYKHQVVYKNPDAYDRLSVGFSTFFLNRTNRSGILKGGVIGGKDQAGEWKLDARFDKQKLISRIKKIARYKSRITLYNEDAHNFLENNVNTLSGKVLIYLDPPYYVKGKDLYDNHYEHQHHLDIAMLIREQINHKWVVSYDNVPEICRIYEGHSSISYGLHYSAQDRYRGSEVMFFGPGVQIPLVENPVKVRENQILEIVP